MATNISPPLEQASASAPATPIANPWHTWGLLVGVLLVSFLGAGRMAESAGGPHGRLNLYVHTIVFEWVIVGYVWMGVKRRGVSLRELIGGKWQRLEDFLLDFAVAVGFWVSWCVLVGIASVAVKHATLDTATAIDRLHELKKTLGFMVPQGGLEIVLAIALTLTAGFCEEVIYRGYFQRQFKAWTQNVALAIVMQGILFGAGHGYQGLRSMAVIAVFGCAFGILAAWRKNLRPGMMAHAWQDFFSIFVLKLLMKLTP